MPIAPNIVTIVPVYNRRHTVLAALGSILAQTLRPKQLIVIDDGSTDGVEEAVRQWMQTAGKSLDCRVIRQANLGVAAARNNALSQADASDFVAFLDSDDVWPADFLARTHAALSSHAGAVAATCDRVIASTKSRQIRRIDCSILAVDAIQCILEHGGGLSSSSLFRRSAIEAHGGFPAKLTGEDVALYLPLSLDGPWLHVPGEPVTYTNGYTKQRGEEGNLSRKFNDNFRCWAKIIEEFFTRGEDRVLEARVKCKQNVARLWYLAGRELYRKSAMQEARECFYRSLEWNRWHMKSHWRLLLSRIKGLRHSDAPQSAESRSTAAAA